MLVAGCQRELELPSEPLPQQVVNPTVECLDDEDCVLGLCGVDNKCDPLRCAEDNDCASGACRSTGFCAYRECNLDEACGEGRICYEYGDRDSACVEGCRDDNGCLDGKTCLVTAGSPYGTCFGNGCEDAPPLAGDPAALAMDDNLAQVVAYVLGASRTRVGPGERLRRAGGWDGGRHRHHRLHLPLDLRLPNWRHRQMEPRRYASVLYYAGAGATCGEYDPQGSGVNEGTSIPQAVWSQWKDATELVPAFTAQPGCAAPAGTSSDHVLYDHLNGTPRFMVSNWQSDLGMGDAVTGAFTYVDCD